MLASGLKRCCPAVFEFSNDQLHHEGAWKGNFAIKDPKAVKHDCQCGRWVTVLKSQWSQSTDYAPHFSVCLRSRWAMTAADRTLAAGWQHEAQDIDIFCQRNHPCRSG